jgi:hypothetical protein
MVSILWTLYNVCVACIVIYLVVKNCAELFINILLMCAGINHKYLTVLLKSISITSSVFINVMIYYLLVQYKQEECMFGPENDVYVVKKDQVV